MQRFDLVDHYLGEVLGIDVASMEPEECRVVESPRRLRCEQSYGFVHALFGMCFRDGRIAISVAPGAAAAIARVVTWHKPKFESDFQRDLLLGLQETVRTAREHMGVAPSGNASEGWLFACRSKPECLPIGIDYRQLHDESIAPADGLRLPTHCFPSGIVYGVVEDGRVVSVAYAHRSGIMEDRVADIGVETAEPYRRRGFAKAVVGAVTAHMAQVGGEALYMCSPSNVGSVATVRSVGFERYSRRIVIPAPAPEEATT